MSDQNDHEILATGRGAHTFRFPPPDAQESDLVLPRRLHVIWIGSEIPAKYLANAVDFAWHNPTWEISLWIDHVISQPIPGRLRSRIVTCDAATFAGRLQNRDLYLEETNLAARADLLRYEIVHYEGGVYLDADTRSLGPGSLELLTRAFLTVSPGYANTNNAQFGFAQGSEFLAYVIRHARDPRVRAFRGDGATPYRTGPTFLTTCVLSFGDWRIVAPNGADLLAKIHHCADKNW